MGVVTWHFHGYQPGDILYRIEDDPGKPIKFKERSWRVSIYSAERRISSNNWTDLMLKLYKELPKILDEITSIGARVSIDIEPQTLDLLVHKHPSTFREIMRHLMEGTFELIMTYPFHPIVPHLEMPSTKDLTMIMRALYEPLLQESSFLGVWFPEGVLTVKTLDVLDKVLSKRQKRIFVIGDECHVRRSFGGSSTCPGVISNTPIILCPRSRSLSDAFSFSLLSTKELLKRLSDFLRTSTCSHCLLAMDLETLFYHEQKIEQFLLLLNKISKAQYSICSAGDFLERIIKRNLPIHEIVEYASWSGYSDVDGGFSLDSRWLGVRRKDFKAFSRKVYGVKISQVWKYAVLKIQNDVINLSRELVKRLGAEGIICNYVTLFFPHLVRFTIKDSSFFRAPLEASGGDLDALLYALRSYYESLMASKSCVRFWEVFDTRVTFQSGSLMASALSDAYKAAYILDEKHFMRKVLDILHLLLNFHNAHSYYNIEALDSVEGWEVSKDAWSYSLTFSIGRKVHGNINALSRGAYYALENEKELLFDVTFPEDLTCDVGYIPSEYSIGSWEV